ncbi:HlyD family secretion protein [Rubripirellula sp.]|nr:biotin/lipoyl-binding protein [Rubripirellula sp.]MDB4749717.1 HlyD family secretion protein [Rubripirellula sp.]
MPNPTQRNDGIWKDAEALIERVEVAARGKADPASFFDDLVGGLRLTTRAGAVTLSVTQDDELILLARSGVLLHAAEEDESAPQPFDAPASEVGLDFASQCRWFDGEFGSRLNACQRLQPERWLQIDFCFEDALDFSIREPISELAEVLLDLAAPVVLRDELRELQRRVNTRTDRDDLIRDLNQGIGLSDSFASIATTLASACQFDRVSLLEYRGKHFRLVTTSARHKVVRRARQIRLMERLVGTVLAESGSFDHQIGNAADLDENVSNALEPYCKQSGFREIHMRLIRDEQSRKPVAAMVVERFQASETEQERIQRKLESVIRPIEDAVRGALKREDSGWGVIASRIWSPANRKKIVVSTFSMIVLVVIAFFVPMELRLSVEGRLVATEQSRLFAPMEGVVSEIPVANGESVEKGMVLIELRSPALDLQRRTVEGSLATAETRLVSLTAMRSRGNAVSNREREAEVAAEERVLRKEIEGLNAQLALLESQQTSLTIRSPMNGLVDRWDLTQSLQSRPVTHGQYLLDIISESGGWTIELDLPEENVNYVLKQQQQEPCNCSFRLRSDPTRTYQGTIAEIAGVANLGVTGKAVVPATFTLNADQIGDLRDGATVVAQVDCGQYPLGFIVFRGLIQWYRSNPWF